jgi:hypothetical protein
VSADRGAQQFDLFRMNLLVSGALTAFALKPPREFEYALLLVPVVSFTLFSLWVHHAFVIRITEGASTRAESPVFECLRRLTFAIAVLANFALIPGFCSTVASN